MIIEYDGEITLATLRPGIPYLQDGIHCAEP
jgi:hypothetical protein